MSQTPSSDPVQPASPSGCCPACGRQINPSLAEADAAEWAFGLADPATPGGSRGGVFYRLRCPGCDAPLIAHPGRRWAEVEAAEVQWRHDQNAHLIFGG